VSLGVNPMSSLITTLGFDVSHTLLAITRSSIKPAKIIALVGSIRGEVDQRAETAYAMLKQFANMIGVDVERVDIDVTDIPLAVEKILRILEENAPATLDLGGGLRLLVIETYIAYTLMNPLKAHSISIYMALEGRNEIISIDVDAIKRRIASSRMIDEIAKKVLECIRGRGMATPKEIAEEMSRSGYRITKQKLSKILTRLLRMGYIEKVERGRYRYRP